MFTAILKLIYYGTITVAVVLFSGLCLIQLAALWQWLK
jgi:hypothetical protein